MISFDIPGTSPYTIDLTSGLPEITKPVVIDGFTQLGPGYAGPPVIELDGSGITPSGSIQNDPDDFDGLYITAGGSTVKGLDIVRFQGFGIILQTGGGNSVTGDYIGVEPDGHTAAGNALGGVLVDASSGNTIGSTIGLGMSGQITQSGNVIAGNGTRGVAKPTGGGVVIDGSGATGNTVVGNYIGVGVNLATVPSYGDGVYIAHAADNTVGGDSFFESNVISGNSLSGIHVLGGDSRSWCASAGNYIGTDTTGLMALGNGGDGIFIDEAPNAQIGGAMPYASNFISDNGKGGSVAAGTNYAGIDISGSTATGNKVPGQLHRHRLYRQGQAGQRRLRRADP